jgi:DNA ligase-1
MIPGFKPMLAVAADRESIKFPVAVSPKYDGVRSIVLGGVVYSRKLKPIPNRHVQALFGQYEGYDGELIAGDPTAPDVFRKTTSAVMSIDGEPDVKFYVFDNVSHPAEKWNLRFRRVVAGGPVERVAHHLCAGQADVDRWEAEWLAAGYEGLMLRAIFAPYKFGRSTAKEGYLLKVKQFTDAEFKVVGYEERMKNENAAERDELGYTKRSSCSAGKVGRGDLGALVLETNGTVFSVGTGFDDAQRAALWAAKESLIGKWAKVKYFEQGDYGVPRFPVFLGFRDKEDM